MREKKFVVFGIGGVAAEWLRHNIGADQIAKVKTISNVRVFVLEFVTLGC